MFTEVIREDAYPTYYWILGQQSQQSLCHGWNKPIRA